MVNEITLQEYASLLFERKCGVNSKQYRELYHELLNVTSFLPTTSTPTERCWYLINNLHSSVLCAHCGENKVPFNKEMKEPRTFCSSLCSSKSDAVKKKREESFKEKFGTDLKEWCLRNSTIFKDKYGVDNPSQVSAFNDQKKHTYEQKSEEVKKAITKKRTDTNLELYGYENCSSSELIKQRRRSTTLSRYGTDNVFQTNEVKQKTKDLYRQKYGNETISYMQRHLSQEVLSALNNKDFLINEHIHLKKSLNRIADELQVGHKTVHNYMIAHGIPVQRFFVSTFEHEVYSFLVNELKLDPTNIIQNNRPFLFELDLHLPTQKIAIECDGIYWHSEGAGKRDRKYHLNKTNVCALKGYMLYHIFENEWKEKPHIWKSILTSALKLNSVVIGARNTSCRKISVVDALKFMNENHLQGPNLKLSNKAQCYGLFDKNTMVGCAIFDRSRFAKNVEWELLRMCFKINHTVVGGVSKLCKEFERDCNPSSLISYADKRYATGNGYKLAGFVRGEDSPPSYYYFVPGSLKLLNRMKYQKHKLQSSLDRFEQSKSEWTNMKDNGFDRIWDCGNQTWYKTYET